VKAVRFDRYGGPEVLEVREVDDPMPGPGEVLVEMRAASINPGEISIREGTFATRFPGSFPSGEGSDLAGVVRALGVGVDGFAIGQEVCGWTSRRGSHAELVAAPADQLAARPGGVPWEVAGSMFVAPMAAYACVRAVEPRPGETVVVSGAAGGVGSIAVQLARRTGAIVIGLASERNHAWLRSHDVMAVSYGDSQADRVREAAGGPIDAFIDTFGVSYVDLAIELGVPVERINTIKDFEAVQRLGVKAQGTDSVASAEVLRELLHLVADGDLEVPIARTYPLSDVRGAYDELAKRGTHGKIVLVP
jgi:NADPH:quinone reductase-like Zn-dependent oxidoreductase